MNYNNLDTELLYSFFMFVWNIIVFSGIIYLGIKSIKIIFNSITMK